MNLFFTASVRGGRAHQPNHERIVAALARYGTVASRHIADKALSQWGETSLDAKEIRERELAALAAADVVVAEVTAPSLGVGYLIAEASRAGKKIVALYDGKDAEKLSGIVKGDPNVTLRLYETEADIDAVLKETLG